MFENLVMTATESEKLHEIFSKKFLRFEGMDGHFPVVIEWEDYISGLGGMEYVRKISNLATTTDYLLEVINRGDFNKYVIRCPAHRDNFIILTKEAAEKVLAIGLP
jgi:hypothetical protein